jgi:hypothetical protein
VQGTGATPSPGGGADPLQALASQFASQFQGQSSGHGHHRFNMLG